MTQEQDPATGGNRRGADQSYASKAINSPSKIEKRKLVFIHVLPDGTEELTDQRPADRPSLCVHLFSNFEETTNCGRLIPDYEMRALLRVPVPPRGRGWKLQRRRNNEDTFIQRWRRPRS
jgi:hypothetical protein